MAKAKQVKQPEVWRNKIVGTGMVRAGDLLANEANWRIHPKAQQDALSGVLLEVGWVQNIIVNKRLAPAWGASQNVETVVDGHLRASLAISQGEDVEVPVVYVDLSPEEEAKVLATLDPIGAMAVADNEQLKALLAEVETDSEAVKAMLEELAQGFDLSENGKGATMEQAHKTLAERFLIPPFSVLDARQGYWQDRKRAWLALGIKSELGRGGEPNHVGGASDD